MLLTVLAFTTLPGLAAEEAVDTLHFKANSFSIAPLEESAGSTTYHVLTMSLPATDGFGPNVNVQIQPYEATLNEYVDLSKRQFKTAKFTIIREIHTDRSHTFEFSGEVQWMSLHFYSKAEMAAGKVYLITATAKESQWEAVGAKLKKCVDSFKRD
jgi:hypothetical protein